MNNDRDVKPMRKPSCLVATVLFLVLAVAAIRFSPAYNFVRHLRYYGEAESFVDRVVEFRTDWGATGEENFRHLLDSVAYRDLNEREMNMELPKGELSRFHVNDMFDIGLQDDGAILWHVH